MAGGRHRDDAPTARVDKILRPRKTFDPDLVNRFSKIVGPDNAVAAPDPQSPFLHELRGAYHGRTPLFLKPGSVSEVSEILKLANASGTAIVPQGGNTGLVGGQIPDDSNRQVVVSLQRLDRVRAVDPDDDSMVVDAGVTLGQARRAAADAGRLFPLAIGSMDDCQIGGNIASNAGGVAVLSYGNMRQLVLGLEVVLANGDVIDGLRPLRKDNSGYDLKQLFIGSEGTLGIITGAVLKLLPAPKGKATAFVGFDGSEAALALFHEARAIAGADLTSFELIPRLCLDFCLKHLEGAFDPLLTRHPWYALVEVSSGRSEASARDDLDAILGHSATGSAYFAENDADAERLWHMRLSLSHVQKPEGVSIKHDISVPVGDVPDFIREATAAVEAVVPGARPVPFGHLGDGNIHFNISQPEGGDGEAFRARTEEISSAVFEVVARYRGSIAAEHGIGQMKIDLLPTVRSPAEMEAMRRIKAVFDPIGIMNPGKVIRMR